MALKYVQVQKHPENMSAAELRAALGGLPDAQIMRSLLVAEVEAIRGGLDRPNRTMRGMWYDIIKPALSRLGILNQTTRNGKPIPWDSKLSVGLTELVREGYTSYEELNIIDGSRQRQNAISYDLTQASVQLTGDHYPWLILFTEKDTIYSIVYNLARLYGVSVISGGGEPSYACTENTVRQIVESDTYEGQPLVLLSLTDYDPYGYTIANAQFVQVQEVMHTIGDNDVYHQRLGVEPDQLTPEERLANAYEPKDKGLDKWFAETGGVDGQPLGIELDALQLSEIQAMFAAGIEQYINLDKRHDDLRAAFVDLLACELLLPDFNDKRKRLNEAIRNDGLWVDIQTAHIPTDLFRRVAVLGWDSIDPLTDTEYLNNVPLFDAYADDVRDAMKEVLENDD